MIRFKSDVLQKLKSAGYSQTRLFREGLIGGQKLTDIRNQAEVKSKTLNVICKILDCQIGDIIEYIPDEEPEEKEQ